MSVDTRLYRCGELEAEGFDPSLVSDYLGQDDTVVWLDLCTPTRQELSILAEEFGLHPLAIEDATKPYQYPKVERYEDHRFLVLYALRVDESGSVRASEVDVFWGARYVITVRKDPSSDLEKLKRRWNEGGALAKHGSSFLVHGLLDEIVDGYFLVVDEMNARVGELEEELFEPDPRPDLQEEIFRARKQIVQFRRHAWPLRDVLTVLTRRDLSIFPEEMLPYYHDVHDHIVRVTESADVMRELLTNALEVHLAIGSNRLNEIMKKVTSWGAVLAVNTAIAGIYGMNFKLVPSDQTLFGFWFAIGLMAVTSVGLFVYFKRKDWL